MPGGSRNRSSTVIASLLLGNQLAQALATRNGCVNFRDGFYEVSSSSLKTTVSLIHFKMDQRVEDHKVGHRETYSGEAQHGTSRLLTSVKRLCHNPKEMPNKFDRR